MPLPSSRIRLIGCVLVYLLGALAGAYTWEHRHDEGNALWIATGGLPRARMPIQAPEALETLLPALVTREALGPAEVTRRLEGPWAMHPPGFYLWANAWLRATGTHRMSMRVPHLLLGVLSILGIRRLARSMLRADRAGEWAGWLLAVSPWFSLMTDFYRPYALALCAAIWSSWLCLEIARGGGRLAARAAYVGLSLLGLYTLYHYAFLVVWQGVVLLAGALASRGRRARALAGLAGVVLAIGLGFAPQLVQLFSHLSVTGGGTWYFSGSIPLEQWPSEGLELLRELLLSNGRELSALVAVLGVATLLLGLAALPRLRAHVPDRIAVVAWLSLPALPLLVLAGDFWHDTHTLFVSKHTFAMFPFLLLGVVLATSSAGPPWARRWLPALWLVVLATGTAVNVRASATTRSDYEEVAREIAAADGSDHVVLVDRLDSGSLIPLLLELRDAGAARTRLQVISGKNLQRAVRNAFWDPSVRRLTLLDLELGGDWGEDWSAQDRQMIASEASAAGVPFRIREPGEGDKRDRGQPRQAVLVSPVWVSYAFRPW